MKKKSITSKKYVIAICFITILILNQSCNNSPQQTQPVQQPTPQNIQIQQPVQTIQPIIEQPTPQPSVKNLRKELAEQEASQPLTYVNVSNVIIKPNETQIPGLFRHSKYDGFIVTGLITNSATLVAFQNIVLTISAYSQTQTLISSQDITIYQRIHPETSQTFRQKIYLPDGTATQNVVVTRATPY